MQKGLLYTLLTAGVLTVAACGGTETTDQAMTSEEASAPADAQADEAAGSGVSSENGPTVLFLGDSITAGFGIDPEQAFPALLQARLDSMGIAATLVNGGLSGETSAGGLRRIDWLLQRPIDVLVLELGGNDGLRGIDVRATSANLQGIIDKTLAANPSTVIVVAGMMMPPNLGRDYTEAFRDVYPALAEANDAIFIPFLLEGVGGIDSLMQNDGIHPNVPGHRKIADLSAPYLLEALEAVEE